MKNLIVFCGKSASGKDTYLNLLTQDEYKDLWKKEISSVVSCTTRPKRDNEIDGKDYYFITKEEMLEKLVRDEMYEITEFNNWFYGTPRSSIKEDKINIGIFNPEGIKILSEEYTNDLKILCVYFKTDDKTRLMRSLAREKSPDVHEILRRFFTDEKDFKSFERSDVFKNKDIKILEIDSGNTERISNNIDKIILTAQKFFDFS